MTWLLGSAALAIVWWLLWREQKRYRRQRDEHLKNSGYGFLVDRDEDKKV